MKTKLTYKNDDQESVKKTFEILTIQYGYDTDQALAIMKNNAIATANAEQWALELQVSVGVHPLWSVGTYYTKDTSVQYNGIAYVTTKSHTSQIGWEPPNRHQNFREIPLKSPNEKYPKWKNPNPNHPYQKDDRVTHNSKDWSSDIDNNVHEPGISSWTDITIVEPEEFPSWVLPTGPADAYAIAAKVSHKGNHWQSVIDQNSWEPPIQWEEVV